MRIGLLDRRGSGLVGGRRGGGTGGLPPGTLVFPDLASMVDMLLKQSGTAAHIPI